MGSCYLDYLRHRLHSSIWYVIMRMDHQLEIFTSHQKMYLNRLPNTVDSVQYQYELDPSSKFVSTSVYLPIMQLENSNSYPRGNVGDEMIYVNVENTIKKNMIVMAVFTALCAVPLMFLIRRSICAEVQTLWIVIFGLACAGAVASCTTDWSVTRAVRSV